MNVEHRSLALLALDRQTRPVQLEIGLGQREPEARAAEASSEAGILLSERFSEASRESSIYADSGVAHRERQRSTLVPREPHAHGAGFGELHGVGEEVRQCVLETVAIEADDGVGRFSLGRERKILRARQRPKDSKLPLDQRGELHTLRRHFERARLDPGNVEDGVDGVLESTACSLDTIEQDALAVVTALREVLGDE